MRRNSERLLDEPVRKSGRDGGALPTHGGGARRRAIFRGRPRKRHIPGIGSSIVPPLLSYAEIDDVVWISERETVAACRELLTRHGLFVGGSSGTAFAAIKRYAAKMRAYKRPRVLFLCADRGTAYLDTVFDHDWATRLEYSEAA